MVAELIYLWIEKLKESTINYLVKVFYYYAPPTVPHGTNFDFYALVKPCIS